MTRFTTVSNPGLSIWLSAVRDVARQSHTAAQAPNEETELLKHPLMQAAVRHTRHSGSSQAILDPDFQFDDDPLAHISHLAFIIANARIHQLEELAEKAEDKLFRLYSSRDPDWVKCIATYTEYYWRGQKPHYHNWQVEGHNNLNYSVIENCLKKDARVGMIGDWGTGMDDALKLVEAMLDLGVDAILHLGDVYYSGTDSEFQHHIVDSFEQAFVKTGKRVPVFSIPGNHDYYCGAAGFYERALSLNRPPNLAKGWEQEASYFCLRTEDNMWQFLGMDTGLNGRFLLHYPPLDPVTPFLDPAEIEWHHDKLTTFPGTTILLSHHQVFSQHLRLMDESAEPWLNAHLRNTFSPFLDNIAAWFWGHEHNLALFQDGLFKLAKGRLLGCSAYEQTGDPYAAFDQSYLDNVPYLSAKTNWRVAKSVENSDYYNHAFAVLDFARKTNLSPIHCTYYGFPSWGENPPTNYQPKELYAEDIYPTSATRCN